MKGTCVTKDYLKTLTKSMFQQSNRSPNPISKNSERNSIQCKPLMVHLKPSGIDRLCRPDRVSCLQLIGIKKKLKQCEILQAFNVYLFFHLFNFLHNMKDGLWLNIKVYSTEVSNIQRHKAELNIISRKVNKFDIQRKSM